MKTARITAILLLGILLVSGVACCPWLTKVEKPTVGYIPQGWYLSGEDPYGTYEELDGTKWGLIEYTDEVDYDFVQIYYGDVPSLLEGAETDEIALIAQAVGESVFDPDETGTMTVSGRLAGYAKAYDSDWNWYEMEVVFVYGDTCIDIYTMYDATSEDEAQVMSLINSISF